MDVYASGYTLFAIYSASRNIRFGRVEASLRTRALSSERIISACYEVREYAECHSLYTGT